jgi:adenosylcobinamide-phosphate synthase
MNSPSPLQWCLFAAILIDLYAGGWFRAGSIFWLPRNILRRLAEKLRAKLDRQERSSGTRLIRGLVGVCFMLGVGAGAGVSINWTLSNIPLGWVLELAILTSLISMGKPWRDAVALASSLQVLSLEDSRKVLRELSDRDATYSDASEITCLGIEAITAHLIFSFLGPVLSYAILGLPGILMYHSIRVMARGHDASGEYLLFSKRLVIVMDWFLSWVGGIILLLVVFLIPSSSFAGVLYQWRTFLNSSQKFKYGPAKLVVAGALGVTLEGPRQYASGRTERLYLGSGVAPMPADLELTARLVLIASVFSAVLVIVGTVFFG